MLSDYAYYWPLTDSSFWRGPNAVAVYSLFGLAALSSPLSNIVGECVVAVSRPECCFLITLVGYAFPNLFFGANVYRWLIIYVKIPSFVYVDLAGFWPFAYTESPTAKFKSLIIQEHLRGYTLYLLSWPTTANATWQMAKPGDN